MADFANNGEVTREQASHVYELCYKYLSEKTMHAVAKWSVAAGPLCFV